MIPEAISAAVEHDLGRLPGGEGREAAAARGRAVNIVFETLMGAVVKRSSRIGGGCIANATRVETGAGTFFLKWGKGEVAETFAAEAEGLRALRKADAPLLIPEVLAVGSGEAAYLLLEWIEQGSEDERFWDAFGAGFATLHRTMGERHGFSISNFIGRLPQQNDWTDTWPAFFAAQRLEPQAAMARERGRWQNSWDGLYERLVGRLPSLIPVEAPPSVLHGDLWSGNYMVASDGRAALVDPATYFGHREADLAMTELFGGFSRRFYRSYDEVWPLEPGYAERKEIYNLYHLINHLNHFGSSYASGVDRILHRFGS